MEAFKFAGFTFPRTVPEFHHCDRTLPSGQGAKSRMRFAYSAAPKPAASGMSFYLDSDFMPGLRWTWADEVDGARIEHTGWWTDPHGDGDSIRGIVFRLPHGRGFLAGHSMGEAMSTSLEYRVYPEECDAARGADRLAEIVAEKERDYQEAWQKGLQAADLSQEARDIRSDIMLACRDLREARREAIAAGCATADSVLRLCDRSRRQVSAMLAEMVSKREERDSLRAEWSARDGFADGYGDR